MSRPPLETRVFSNAAMEGNDIENDAAPPTCFLASNLAKALFAFALVVAIAGGVTVGIIMFPPYHTGVDEVQSTEYESNQNINANNKPLGDNPTEQQVINYDYSVAWNTGTGSSGDNSEENSKPINTSANNNLSNQEAKDEKNASSSRQRKIPINAPHCGKLNKYAPNTLLMRTIFGRLGESDRFKAGQLDKAARKGRIVGGKSAKIESHPWQVSMWTENGHTCGGSIIASHWMVTAAHCTIVYSLPRHWTLFIGETKLRNMEEGDPEESLLEIKATDVITHQFFQDSTYNNDIALIRFSEDIDPNKYINSVCLPPDNILLVNGTKCLVSGFGVTTEGGNLPKQLQEASVDIISNSICNQPDWLDGMVSTLMICAGTVDGSQDACQGDSGGPLVCMIPNGGSAYYLMGLVSWGVGCGVPRMPGVYTDVAKYRNWIKTNMEETDATYPQL